MNINLSIARPNPGVRYFALLLLSVSPCLQPQLTRAQSPADLSGDGYVTAYDAHLLEQRLHKRRSLSGSSQMALDANSDGRLDEKDVAWVKSNYSANVCQQSTIILDGSSNWTLIAQTSSRVDLIWCGVGQPAIRKGSVLLKKSAPSMLEYILNVEIDGDTVHCDTRPALLNEAYVNANFSVAISFNDKSNSPSLPNNNSTTHDLDPISGSWNVHVNDSLEVEAQIHYDPVFLIEWSLDGPYIRAEAIGDLNALLLAHLNFDVGIDAQGDVPIVEVPVAGVPFLSDVTFTLSGKYNIRAQAELTADAGVLYDDTDVKLGAIYDQGLSLISPTADLKNFTPIVQWQLAGNLNATLALHPGFEFEILGLARMSVGAGPFADLDAYAQLNPLDCHYELNGGLSAEACADIVFVGPQCLDEELYRTPQPLLSGDPCDVPPPNMEQGVPTASIISISPNPATQGKDSITFRGFGEDPDDGGKAPAIDRYRWVANPGFSDVSGADVLYEGSESDHTLPLAAVSRLTLGHHTVELTVRRARDGVWSSVPATAQIEVVENTPPQAGTFLTGGTVESPILVGQSPRYSIVYRNTEGVVPSSTHVVINAMAYNMDAMSGDYTTGKLYAYEGRIFSTAGSSNTYYFELVVSGETERYPETDTLSGPVVANPNPATSVNSLYLS